MTAPALDILLPFYGPPERLRETVGSVLTQTRADWRLTVVDDAWPGEPVGPWLDQLDDDRVRYVRHPANLGLNRNFQHCLDLAEAPYLTLTNGDDLLLPTYVETVLGVVERTGATVVQPGVVVVDDTGQRVRPLVDRIKQRLTPRAGSGDDSSDSSDVVLAGEDLVASLVVGNWTYFPSLTLRRAEAQAIGFRPELATALDLQLLLDLAFTGATLAVVPDEAFAYRRHAASFSSQTALSVDRFDEEAAVLDRARARSIERGWARAARRAGWRPTSRLHALTLLPGARGRRRRRLARHAFGRSR